MEQRNSGEILVSPKEVVGDEMDVENLSALFGLWPDIPRFVENDFRDFWRRSKRAPETCFVDIEQ
jgi:hypothetical protein